MGFKNYLISFLATIKGHKTVSRGLTNISKTQKRVKTTTDKSGKSVQSFDQVLKKAGKRALIVAPVWLALRSAMLGVIRTISGVVRANLELEEGMARIRTVMHGSSESIEADIKVIERTILDMATKTRISLKELSEAFYFLKTSNLETEEAVAGFVPTVNAMVGTGIEAKDMARAVAGSFNTMGQYMDETLTSAEKFQKISDVLTYTYACYTPDTEVLTDKGWKYFKNLDRTEKVATLNPKNNRIEYQKPIEYVVKHFNGKLCHLKGRFADIKVTPRHKLYTKVGYRPKSQKYILTEAEKVFGRPKGFYRGSNWIGENPEYFVLPGVENKTGKSKAKKIPMKLWLKFLGWYLSEGSYTWKNADDPTYRITIYQSKKSKYWNKLSKVMEEIPFHVSEFERGFIINNKQLCHYLKQFGKSYEKYIPDFVKGLSKDLLRCFINTYTLGDGYYRKNCDSFGIITSSEKMKDDFQEIALKANYGSTCHFRKGTKKTINGIHTKSRGSWSVSFSERVEFLMYNKKNEYYANKENRKITSIEEWIDYKGLVYCVEVPKYHTLFVRRNGKSFWCGNTQDVQLDELVEGYTKLAPYLSGVSDSFTDIVTLLGFLNTRLLRSGRTGRLTGRALLQLTKNADKLASIFGITFDPDKPINFLNTIKLIKESLGESAKITAEQAEALRRVFATRGAVAIRLAIANYEDLAKAIKNADENAEGFSERVARIRMGTTIAQANRFRNILAVLGNDLISGVYASGDFASALKDINNALVSTRPYIDTFGKTIGWLSQHFSNSILLISRWSKTLRLGLETVGNALLLKIPQAIEASKKLKKEIKSATKDTEDMGLLEFEGFIEYANRIDEIKRKRAEERKELQKIEELQKDLAPGGKINIRILKEKKEHLRHIASLMKERGASELDIARYRAKTLIGLKKCLSEEKYILQLTKAHNKVIEKEASYRRELTSLLIEQELALLRTRGISESQVLSLKANLESVLFTEQSELDVLKNLLEIERAITAEKEEQRSVSSESVKLYKLAQKYGINTAKAIGEVLQGISEFEGLTGRERRVISKAFPTFTQGAIASKFFFEGAGREIPIEERPTPTGIRRETISRFTQIAPTIPISVKSDLKVNLDSDRIIEKINEKVRDAIKDKSSDIRKSINNAIEEF